MKPIAKFDTNPGDVGVRVTVYNEVDGSTTDLLFKQLPVRIGRNKLNELVLNHQYVSQWHAVVGFVRGQLSVIQVGSSNSVQVGDRRLTPNENMALGERDTIRIVPFRLYVQAMQVSRAPAPAPHRETAQRTGYSEAVAAAARAPESVGQAALQRVALEVLDRLAQRFLGRRLDHPETVAGFGARLEQLLDVFLRSFVALQRGQEQFRQALDISLAQGDGALDRARSAKELGALLFAPNGSAVGALEQAFKDVMVHQVALLNGLMAGVRTLLGKLSPRAVMIEAGGGARRSPALKQVWETYKRMHRDLEEEDNEAFETIFGSQFTKAYATLVDSRTRKGRD